MVLKAFLSSPTRWRPVAAALLAVIFWASSFVAIKFALAEMQPITMIWLRLLFGVMTLVILALRRGVMHLPVLSDLPRLGAAGLVGVVAQQWLQAQGMLTTTATASALLSAVSPALIVLLAWWWLGERLVTLQVIGFVLAGIGAILVSAGNWQAVIDGNFGGRGDLLVLGSCFAFAAYSIMTKRLVYTRSVLTVTLSTLTLGWLMLMPEFIYRGAWLDLPGISWVGWVAVLVLGVGGSGLALLLYNYALQSTQVTIVAVLQYPEPLIAAGFAWLLLRESLFLGMALGGGLILTGVWLVERSGISDVSS